MGYDRVYLRWRPSFATLLFRWFGTVMSLVALVLLYASDDIGFFLVGLLVFVAAPFAFEYLQRGYRISYDDDAVYMRPHGVDWALRRRADSRVAFDQITAVTGERSARSIGFGNRLTPFEYAAVHGRGSEGGEPIALVGAELYDEDLREILHVIDTRAPGTLDKAVRTWLQGSGRF